MYVVWEATTLTILTLLIIIGGGLLVVNAVWGLSVLKVKKYYQPEIPETITLFRIISIIESSICVLNKTITEYPKDSKNIASITSEIERLLKAKEWITFILNNRENIIITPTKDITSSSSNS